jgi:hypothetical protein
MIATLALLVLAAGHINRVEALSFADPVDVHVESYFDSANIVFDDIYGLSYGSRVSFASSLGSWEGYEFAFWIVNGSVRTDLPSDYAFIVTNNLSLTALFRPTDEFYVLFLDANGRKIDLQFVTPGGDATEPSLTYYSKPRMDFAAERWSTSYTNVTTDVVTVLQYEHGETDATHTLTVMNGTGSGTFADNEIVVVTAEADGTERYFQYWMVGNKIMSYDRIHAFTLLEDVVIEAVYGTTPASASGPYVSLSGKLDLRDGYLSFLGQVSLPDGYTLVEWGILNHETIYDVTLDIPYVRQFVGTKMNGYTGEFLMSLPSIAIRNVRAYLVYQTPEGTTDVVYNDTVPVPEGLLYEESFGTITITGYTGTATDLRFPDSIDGMEVYTIGANAFKDATTLVSIELPASVGIIEAGAFEGCTSLVSIVLPDLVSVLPDRLFAGCTSLSSITFEGLVQTIGTEAFAGCTSLVSFVVPESVSTIGASAFAGCTALAKVTLSRIETIPGSLFAGCTSLETVVFAADLTTISASAFQNCTSLASIVLPDTVASIGTEAFRGCTALGEIVIPAGVDTLGDGVFRDCSNLVHAVILGALSAFGTGVFQDDVLLEEAIFAAPANTIGASAFQGCSSLARFTMPAFEGEIGAFAFQGCTALADFSVSVLTTAIGASAFAGCAGLTEITIPANVATVGADAFSGCAALSITVRSLTGSTSSWDPLWNPDDRPVTTEIQTTGATSVLTYAKYGSNAVAITGFVSGAAIADLVVPETIAGLPVLAIAANAFSTDTTLVTVALPASVRFLFESAFEGASNLVSVTFGEGSILQYVGTKAFRNCESLSAIVFPASLLKVSAEVFRGCAALTAVEFFGNLSLETGIFRDCVSLTSVTLPEGVREIGYEMFYGCTSLVSVTLPSSVYSVATSAFEGCTSLATVSASGLSFIGRRAFYGCAALSGLPATTVLRSIGDEAFLGCTGLSSVAFPASLVAIGIRAFKGDTGLLSVSFSTTHIILGEEAFRGCTGLTALALPWFEGNAVPAYAFAECANLTEVTFDVNLATIGDHAFYKCSSLATLGWNLSPSAIGAYAFFGCALEEIVLPSGLRSIGDYAFAECESLSSVVVPAYVDVIGNHAFHNMRLDLVILVKRTSAGDGYSPYWNSGDPVVYGYSSRGDDGIFRYALKTDGSAVILGRSEGNAEATLTIPTTIDGHPVERLVAFAFADDTIVQTILAAIPALEEGTFLRATALTHVSFGTGTVVESIGAFAFEGCTSLVTLTVPDTVSLIGAESFYGCTGLQSIYIPKTVTYVRAYAFTGCTNVKIYREPWSAPAKLQCWTVSWSPEQLLVWNR